MALFKPCMQGHGILVKFFLLYTISIMVPQLVHLQVFTIKTAEKHLQCSCMEESTSAVHSSLSEIALGMTKVRISAEFCSLYCKYLYKYNLSLCLKFNVLLLHFWHPLPVKQKYIHLTILNSTVFNCPRFSDVHIFTAYISSVETNPSTVYSFCMYYIYLSVVTLFCFYVSFLCRLI